jgi:hypothetical protein
MAGTDLSSVMLTRAIGQSRVRRSATSFLRGLVLPDRDVLLVSAVLVDWTSLRV